MSPQIRNINFYRFWIELRAAIGRQTKNERGKFWRFQISKVHRLCRPNLWKFQEKARPSPSPLFEFLNFSHSKIPYGSLNNKYCFFSPSPAERKGQFIFISMTRNDRAFQNLRQNFFDFSIFLPSLSPLPNPSFLSLWQPYYPLDKISKAAQNFFQTKDDEEVFDSNPNEKGWIGQSCFLKTALPWVSSKGERRIIGSGKYHSE